MNLNWRWRSTYSCSTGSGVSAESGWAPVGGSQRCSARLHRRTCMSQERRLYFLYLFGVEGWSLGSLRCLRRRETREAGQCRRLRNRRPIFSVMLRVLTWGLAGCSSGIRWCSCRTGSVSAAVSEPRRWSPCWSGPAGGGNSG